MTVSVSMKSKPGVKQSSCATRLVYLYRRIQLPGRINIFLRKVYADFLLRKIAPARQLSPIHAVSRRFIDVLFTARRKSYIRGVRRCVAQLQTHSRREKSNRYASTIRPATATTMISINRKDPARACLCRADQIRCKVQQKMFAERICSIRRDVIGSRFGVRYASAFAQRNTGRPLSGMLHAYILSKYHLARMLKDIS
jgi:hypothetical protein